ncbi:MAG: hypothetical protein AAFY56_17450 [Pseudomonadota bacterium]
MFGLTINKIIFTVLLIAAVWRGFRWLEQAKARGDLAVKNKRQQQAAKPRANRKEPPRPAVDLVPCLKCGAYVPNGTFCPDKDHCLMKTDPGDDKRSHAA